MEPAISSYAPKRLVEPVTFSCVVKDRPLVAQITKELDDPITHSFQIKFSDGITLETTLMENGAWWVNDLSKVKYVEAIRNELTDFIFVKNWPWLKFEIEHGGEKILVWTCKTENEISVYFRGEYQFNLNKVKKGWEAVDIRVVNTRKIDKDLSNKIAKMIEGLE